MAIGRRQFLQSGLGAAAAVALSAQSRAADVADIRVAQIGFRSQGANHINTIRKNIVALCDVDQRVLDRMAERLKREHNQTVDKYSDYRKLLERDDIDAVSIATPNHTHALISIAAAQAGKDVYCEKPVSHNIWEGRQIVAAAERHGRIIQTGTQSRSNRALQEAVRFVKDGELGAVRYVVATCYKPRPPIGKLDSPLQIPSYVDYDLWCGPAERSELFRPQLHYDWHWDFNTGAGDLGNQGIHQMDVARWFLNQHRLPPRVWSVGGRLGYQDAGDTPNTQLVWHDYQPAPLLFEVRGLPRSSRFQQNGRWGGDVMDRFRGSQIGVVVQCEQGNVLVPSNSSRVAAFDLQGRQIKEWRGGGAHHENWLRAIASGDADQLAAPIVEGHVSSALCHAGNISYRLGRPANAEAVAETVRGDDLLSGAFERMASHLRANGVDVDNVESLTLGAALEIDGDAESFVGPRGDAANQLRKRKYRDPFVVPDIQRDLAAGAVSSS